MAERLGVWVVVVVTQPFVFVRTHRTTHLKKVELLNIKYIWEEKKKTFKHAFTHCALQNTTEVTAGGLSAKGTILLQVISVVF